MASTYRTILGDTWDLIAYKQYGAEKYMKNLIEANPKLSDIMRFDAGMEITVPDLPVAISSRLPFWHSTDDNSIWGEEAV